LEDGEVISISSDGSEKGGKGKGEAAAAERPRGSGRAGSRAAGGAEGGWDALDAPFQAGGNSGRYFAGEDESVKCYNCGEAGHRSRDCKSARRVLPCYSCGLYGHTKATCPNGLCFTCHQPGHLSRACPIGPARARARGKGARGDVCMVCGQRGHDALDCPRGYPSSDLRAVRCFACGALGHLTCNQVRNDLVITYTREFDGEEAEEAEEARRAALQLQQQQAHNGAGGRRRKRKLAEGVADVVDGLFVAQTDVFCSNCGEAGHSRHGCDARDVTSYLAQYKGGIGEPSRGRGGQGGGGRGGFGGGGGRGTPSGEDDAECFKCGETGHFARNCPQANARPSFGGGGSGGRTPGRGGGRDGRPSYHDRRAGRGGGGGLPARGADYDYSRAVPGGRYGQGSGGGGGFQPGGGKRFKSNQGGYARRRES